MGFLAGLAGGAAGAILWGFVVGQAGRYQYVRSGNAGFLVDTAKGDVLFRPLPGEGYRMFNLRTGKVGRRASSGEAWEFKTFEESWTGGTAKEEEASAPPVERETEASR